VTGQYVRPDVTLTLVSEIGGSRVGGNITYAGTALNDQTMVLSGTTFHRASPQ
jgi:hypothetical protein